MFTAQRITAIVPLVDRFMCRLHLKSQDFITKSTFSLNFNFLFLSLLSKAMSSSLKKVTPTDDSLKVSLPSFSPLPHIPSAILSKYS